MYVHKKNQHFAFIDLYCSGITVKWLIIFDKWLFQSNLTTHYWLLVLFVIYYVVKIIFLK